MMRPPLSHKGLTLLEFSVALAVLGIIVGGVIVSQNMIRASQLTSILADANSYKRAMDSFITRYGYLPGDMPTAESYWGSDTGCPNTATNSIPKRVTCNGDNSTSVTTATTANEPYRFWQHLSNAGMLNQNFTGVAGAAADVVFETNAPGSAVPSGGWSVITIGTASGSGNWFDGSYGTVLFFGGAGGAYANGALLTPSEASNTDKKIDDGLPGQGNVLSWKSSAMANCATTDVITTAAYNLTGTSATCALIFKSGY